MKPRKTKGADLENKKFMFLEAGLIVALGLVLLAFNWKSYDKTEGVMYDRVKYDIPEEIVPIIPQKPPEPPKVQPPRMVAVINIVDTDDPVDENIIIDAGADDQTVVEPYVPKVIDPGEEVGATEDEIFKVVESNPEFPGGEANLYKYLADNLEYPYEARELNISGKVWVTFVVEKNGSITDVQVLRGIGGGCDEEAVRVVKAMPKWTPGKQRGIPVRVQFVLSVKFTLY